MSSEQRVVDRIAPHGPWFYKRYQARFLPWHTQVYAIQKMQRTHPWTMEHCGTVGTPDGMQAWMWSTKELDATRKAYINHVLTDTTFLDNMEKRFMDAWNACLACENEYKQRQQSLSLPERIAAFVELSERETDAAQHVYINDCFLHHRRQRLAA